VAPPPKAAACESSVEVARGDTFADLSRRCYGSRSYADWLAAHTGHEKKGLRAGETLDIPPFATLVTERIGPKWSSQAAAIAQAYEHYRLAEPNIEAQLRAAGPGAAAYHPNAAAKAALVAAAAAIRPVVDRLRAQGVRTKKFAQALEAFELLADGKGSHSTDYATEEIHQCFSYGVDALR
jgi:hypothetical protein